MNYLDYIRNMWACLYDKHNDVETVIINFFHENYVQCINGTTLKRNDYIKHVIMQRKRIKSLQFTYHQAMQQNDALFLIYNIIGNSIENSNIEAEVIAYFEFKDNKIYRIHGQVHLLKGSLVDADMN